MLWVLFGVVGLGDSILCISVYFEMFEMFEILERGEEKEKEKEKESQIIRKRII